MQRRMTEPSEIRKNPSVLHAPRRRRRNRRDAYRDANHSPVRSIRPRGNYSIRQAGRQAGKWTEGVTAGDGTTPQSGEEEGRRRGKKKKKKKKRHMGYGNDDCIKAEVSRCLFEQQGLQSCIYKGRVSLVNH